MPSRRLFDPPPAPGGAVPRRASAAPSGSRQLPYTVRQLAEGVRRVVEDGFPAGIWLEGELSQVTDRRHLYLSFREGSTVLEAVAWESDARGFDFAPQRGDRVRAFGRLRTYAERSRYQFQIRRLERAGLGALLQELLEREQRLEAEGLFDPARKRPVPFLPLRIGLLTAVGSDAWADFTKAANARFPGVRIRERNTPVQGATAPTNLVAGIRALGRLPLDVIVVARGGGSVEDLLPFSDESVIRAAAACPLPLVSAIGHEQNRPLLDRAADLRASTPSAAARDLLPERSELQREIEERGNAADGAARHFVRAAGQRIEALRTHRATAALPEWIEREHARLLRDRQTAREAAMRALDLRADRLKHARRRIEATRPAARLAGQLRELGELRERLAALLPLRGPEERLAASRARLSPEPIHRRIRDGLAGLAARRIEIGSVAARQLEARRSRVTELGTRLEALDPRAVLRRGYSLALDAAGRAVVSAAGVGVGDPLRLLLGEGELDARVEQVRPAAEGAIR